MCPKHEIYLSVLKITGRQYRGKYFLRQKEAKGDTLFCWPLIKLESKLTTT